MPQNAHHGESHPSKVAEGVTHEDLWGEFIVLEEPQSNHDERYDDSEREDVLGNDLGRDG